VKKQLTLERTYEASLEEVWRLWTTAAGIESWWGPEGFTVKVRSLDLKPGGELLYDMTATGAPQVQFMKKAGMPLTTLTRITFTEVTAQRRLAYNTLADFIPGMAPYPVATQLDLSSVGGQVRLVLTFDAMHDADWTKRSVMGREMELAKLAKVLAR